MNNLIVKFTNKLDPSEFTDKIQLDIAIDVTALTSLLNLVLTKESEYFFFYKEERILENLSKIIEKHNLNTEETIEINFIDTKDIKADHLTECDDTVKSFCSLEDQENQIFYLTYSGDVCKYGNNQIQPLKNIQKISSSGKRLLGLRKESIFDILENKEIYTAESEIHSFDAFEDSLVAVLSNKIDLILGDYKKDNIDDASETDNTIGKVEILKGENLLVRDIKINNKFIVWIQKHDTVGIYNRENKKTKLYETKYCLTKLGLYEDKVILSSGNNSILGIENDQVIYYNIPYRLSNCIKKCESGFAYSSQHDIVLISIGDDKQLVEKSILRVEGQVNDILVTKDMLLVANDNLISAFKIQRFQ